MKTIVPIGNHQSRWKPTENAVLENVQFGSLRHRMVLDGSEPDYDFPQLIEQPGIAVLPIRGDGTAGLLDVYRPGVLRDDPQGKYPEYKMSDFGDRGWEACRGLNNPGELGSEAARRELFEETGLSAIELQYVGKVFLNPANLPVPTELFLALVSDGEPVPQSSEGIAAIRFFSRDELNSLVLSGGLRCGLALALIAHAIMRGKL